MMEWVVLGVLVVISFGTGYFIRGVGESRRIANGVQFQLDLAVAKRKEAMKVNDRETWLRPEHEDEEPSRVGRVDIDGPDL
jgi:hypothetical protein